MKRNIPKWHGNSQGALTERERFPWMTGNPQVVAQIDGQLAQSPLIAERPRQAFGFAKIADDPLELSERKECSSKGKAKINALLLRGRAPRLRLEDMQRLLEEFGRLAVGPSRIRKPPRLDPVANRL